MIALSDAIFGVGKGQCDHPYCPCRYNTTMLRLIVVKLSLRRTDVLGGSI